MATESPELDKLFERMLEDPEILQSEELNEDTVLALFKKLNPYGPGAGAATQAAAPGRKRVAVISCTNLLETYLRRLTFTSMAGFLFRMLREWEVPAEARRWTTKKAKKAAKGKETAPFAAASLARQAAEVSRVAAEAAKLAQASEEAEASLAEYREGLEFDHLPGPEENSEIFDRLRELSEASSLARAKAAGGLYAATLAARDLGDDCDRRFEATEAQAREFPAVQDLLEQAAAAGHRPRPPRGQQEIPQDVAKKIINGFLSNWFEYNPDAHARKAYDAFSHASAFRPIDGLTGVHAVAEDSLDAGSDAASSRAHEESGEGEPAEKPAAELTPRALASPMPEPEAPEDVPHFELIRGVPEARRLVLNYLAACRAEGVGVAQECVDAAFRAGSGESRRLLLAAARATEAGMQPSTLRAVLERARALPEAYRRAALAASEVRALAACPPPADTFYRWGFYTDVNYEELRESVAALYPERPSLDWALNIYDVFEGSEEEVQKKVDAFRDQHEREVISDFKVVELGSWTFLASFKANRESIDVRNKRTKVLQEILDQHARDQKLGEDIMKHRVRKAKARNIAEDGPDAPGLTDYINEQGSKGMERGLSATERARLERSRGNLSKAREYEHVEDCRRTIRNLTQKAKTKALDPQDKRELREAQDGLRLALEQLEVPDNAIQVDVWCNDADGKVVKKRMYTEAEAPSETGRDAGQAASTASSQRRPPARPQGEQAGSLATPEAAPSSDSLTAPLVRQLSVDPRALPEDIRDEADRPLADFAAKFDQEFFAKD